MRMAEKQRSPRDIERGKRLKEAREKIKLTQEELADALAKRGHDVAGGSTIGNWEQGTRFTRDIDCLIDLAEICETFVSVILGLPEAPIDRRQGQINTIYNRTDERGRDAIWRIAESQPAGSPSRDDDPIKVEA